ncbi:C4-dicarboxylate ABC transporter substrate-binding protein [Frankia canadensis]|uniref:C4-dicarboxylate ABC transporter substrate-binding protein n=1 Tax=Frankia canadensis TaxID=1836972 RepID=A0A2I2KWV9_9ACTN|nr:TAXI family TRAP transporter solute-binding subunit [Frankia canadensis]SNQ50144.1 C4-dicarboxylate ABC transporter substrate-binding protein [Frankia canadensis]SOU57434.1 C4-dicarboxylate ABC transporter substrate-binding protein [Frankia canadensis]
MRLSRRAVLLGAGAAALGVAVDGVTSSCSSHDRTVSIAAGEPDGFYIEFANLLRPFLHARVVPTLGSVQNIRAVDSGSADLGLALADSLDAARTGAPAFGPAVTLYALGRVYENYMQLVVRADSPVRTVTDLAGRSVSLGANGSGAALFGERLFATAGVVLGQYRHLSLKDAVGALRDNLIDAMLWSGGVPTEVLAEADRAWGIRLIELGGLVPELRQRFGRYYNEIALPAGIYRSADAVRTVGVPNLLVTGTHTSDDTIRETVRVLVEHAGQLVPRQARGTQYLDVGNLINTGPLPLHPAAADAYRELRG